MSRMAQSSAASEPPLKDATARRRVSAYGSRRSSAYTKPASSRSVSRVRALGVNSSDPSVIRPFEGNDATTNPWLAR